VYKHLPGPVMSHSSLSVLITAPRKVWGEMGRPVRMALQVLPASVYACPLTLDTAEASSLSASRVADGSGLSISSSAAPRQTHGHPCSWPPSSLWRALLAAHAQPRLLTGEAPALTPCSCTFAERLCKDYTYHPACSQISLPWASKSG
jgi:hypothetical protein